MKNSRRRGGGRWTFLVASRYFRSKRKDKNFASSVLSVVGIAVGTMTLITVLAVMNGFQIGFINASQKLMTMLEMFKQSDSFKIFESEQEAVDQLNIAR